MFERRDTVHACTYMYVFADQSTNSISSRGDYSRAASISFRACSGAATIRERRLFERGVYSVIYGSHKQIRIRKRFRNLEKSSQMRRNSRQASMIICLDYK